LVTGGVDAHSDTHHAAALDERGRLLGDSAFATSAEGYQELLAWLESFGPIARVGVESTGSYAAGLTRFLAARGVAVVEVNQPHAHTRRRRGKSDPLDAEAAARKVLAGEATAVAKQTGGIVESIRQLRVAREGAVKANTAALLERLVFQVADAKLDDGVLAMLGLDERAPWRAPRPVRSRLNLRAHHPEVQVLFPRPRVSVGVCRRAHVSRPDFCAIVIERCVTPTPMSCRSARVGRRC
jgi:transposase